MGTSVITGCDASPVFELGKQIFDFVAGFVEHLAIFNWPFAVFLRRDTGCDVLLGQQIADFVTIIAFVAQEGFGPWQVFQEYICALEVTALPFRDVKPDRSTQLVAQGMQFGVHSALGTAYQPWFIAPFLRLLAVRCAFR